MTELTPYQKQLVKKYRPSAKLWLRIISILICIFALIANTFFGYPAWVNNLSPKQMDTASLCFGLFGVLLLFICLKIATEDETKATEDQDETKRKSKANQLKSQ